MTISSIGNQGHTSMTGVEKTTAADKLKERHQANTDKNREAANVSISTEARNRAKAEGQKAAELRANERASQQAHKKG